jgi:hypothetical protein
MIPPLQKPGQVSPNVLVLDLQPGQGFKRRASVIVTEEPLEVLQVPPIGPQGMGRGTPFPAQITQKGVRPRVHPYISLGNPFIMTQDVGMSKSRPLRAVEKLRGGCIP